ncbi:hypothetical protein LTR49_003508 [Elasticomyces elasticus]|nr:hypothetical protein LTR49_003508 [Elasticomyces elasticus]
MAPLLTPSSRRIKFHLALTVHDLNNVPLVSGSSYIKWHLPSSTAAEHRGRTPKCAIKDHRVLYDYSKSIPVRLTVGKDGVLVACEVWFEVVQEYSAGGRAERLKLGEVRLNLAEYCQADGDGSGGEGGEEGIVRRYLMQESKINSTLKLGITMRHLEGTRDYVAPPLRTAPVFGGIAGIISSEQPVATHPHPHNSNDDPDNQDATSSYPTLSATNKEIGETQDLYRRTLAAYWSSQMPFEMRADECIEDIFAGGDGWGKNGRPPRPVDEDAESQHQNGMLRGGSGSSTPNMDARPDSRPGSSNTTGGVGGVGRRSVVGEAGRRYSTFGGKTSKKARMPPSRRGQGEIDEFEVREDLRSWNVGGVT